MTFSKEHKAYADAIILETAEKLIIGKASSKARARSKAAAKISYSFAVAYDGQLRPSSPKNWRTATAKKVNSAIKSAASKEVKAIYKKMSSSGQLAALGLMGGGVVVAGANIASQHSDVISETIQTLCRRGFIGGAGAIALTTTILAPSAAKADNTAYIKSAKAAAKAYARSNAPKTLKSVHKSHKG